MPLDATVVPKGKDVSLVCKLTGLPKPEVTWEYNGEPLPTDDTHVASYSPENDTHHLTITDTTLQDSGRYTAVAKNPFGTAKCTAEVLIEGTCNVATFLCRLVFSYLLLQGQGIHCTIKVFHNMIIFNSV